MKKLALIVLAIAILLVPMSIAASAAGDINTYEKIVLDALKAGVEVDSATVTVPAEYITQAENFLKTIDMTETQSKEIIAKIDDTKALIKASDIHSSGELDKLPVDTKQKILDNGKAAAAVVDAVLTYDGEDVKVTFGGDTVFEDTPIVKVTGAEADFTLPVVAVAGSVLLLAAAAVVASKKGLLSK